MTGTIRKYGLSANPKTAHIPRVAANHLLQLPPRAHRLPNQIVQSEDQQQMLALAEIAGDIQAQREQETNYRAPLLPHTHCELQFSDGRDGRHDQKSDVPLERENI